MPELSASGVENWTERPVWSNLWLDEAVDCIKTPDHQDKGLSVREWKQLECSAMAMRLY